jgi:signal peptide peptidase SppA
MTPLLIDSESLNLIERRIAARDLPENLEEDMDTSVDVEEGEKTAIVRIGGAISKRRGTLARLLGMGVSASELTRVFNRLSASSDYETVILDIDSPGGSYMGVPEATMALENLSDKKEVVALADGKMASGAYWLGSAADKVAATPSSQIGSIGAVRPVVSKKEKMEDEGIDVEIVRGGEKKAKPHPSEQLTDESVSIVEERVKRVFDEFTSVVAQHRPDAEMDEVATGEVFFADDAEQMGLVDEIASREEVIGNSSDVDPEIVRRASDIETAERKQRKIHALSDRLDSLLS